MQLRYDLHLSAYTIARKTILGFEDLGFSRDLFSNNTRCDTTAYHGTYRGTVVLPSDSLWTELVALIRNDQSFVGVLEQESYSVEDVRHVSTSEEEVENHIAPISAHYPVAGQYKQCDIHVNVSLSKSNPESVRIIEQLGFASFDKAQPDGVHRIFSITCNDLSAGMALHEALFWYLSRIPQLSVKFKFERTDRFVRVPADAPTLPMVGGDTALAWIASVTSLRLGANAR